MPVTVSHAKSNTIPDWAGTVTVGNSTGGTTTAAASDLIRPSDWNSVHQNTLQLTGSEIASLFSFGVGLSSVSGPGGVTVGFNDVNFFEPFLLPNTNSTLSAPGNGTWYIDGPYDFDNGFGSGQFFFPVSQAAGVAFVAGANFSAASTGSVSKYQSFSNNIAIYGIGAGAQSSRLESVWTGGIEFRATQIFAVTSTASNNVRVSNSLTLSFPSQFDASGGMTYTTTSTGGSTSLQSTTMTSNTLDTAVSSLHAYVSAPRMDIIPFASTLAPGIYWIGHMFSSTSSTTGTNYGAGTLLPNQSRLGLLENNLGAFKRLGVSVSDSTSCARPFHGYFATVSSAAPSPINTSNMRPTTVRAYWNFQQTSY